jgi:hypothetical protein
LRAQRLAPRWTDSTVAVADLVRHLGGAQAQDPSAAALALRVRGTGLVTADVERARIQERSIVRTWAMRGTLHLVAAEDLGWLLPLLGPIFVQGNRRRYAELGLDEDVSARAIRLIRDALASQGPLTRAELVARLAARGIRAEGQAAPHILGRAALEGHVCLGPDRDGKLTYVLLDDWVEQGSSLLPDAALVELARRYLAAYAPVGPEDLAAWSGIRIGQARAAWQGIADELVEVEGAGGPAWLPKTHAAWLEESPPPAPVVRLLPSFDVYLLGYRGRDLAVAPEHARRVHPGGGVLRPTLLVDGRAAGTWRRTRRRDRLEVVIEPFAELAAAVRLGIEAEVEDVGRFLRVEASFRLVSPA